MEYLLQYKHNMLLSGMSVKNSAKMSSTIAWLKF